MDTTTTAGHHVNICRTRVAGKGAYLATCEDCGWEDFAFGEDVVIRSAHAHMGVTPTA